uniref:E3 ubiquitin-protein ligase TRIM21-like isoform X2 n=1 Tax=Gasterosteus aculeatus aculeatus TaxID=481459 RepID=UPI001A9810C6|nr:E3 ubiquitin-protein ligase TRIM21-like isoform X2 [Gasterosteus aculeatus aculeatus]
MSHQVCHCGWSKVTTYQGLRTHQGMMGCTPKGKGIPESQQFIFNGSLPKPAYPGPLMAKEPLMNINTPAFKSDEKLHSSGSQQDIWGVHQGDGGSFSRTTPVKTEIGSAQLGAAALDALVKETNEWAFQTPPPCATTHQAPARQAPARQAPVSACRALDFNTSAQQVTGQLFWAPPTTTAQETFGPNERQKERETQQLQKVRQDRTRADLQHDIQTRERKMAEVRSSVKACKGGLDAEWLEINDVFAGVMRAVEGARRKALGPLEERRKKVKKEAELLVQRLQKEIDKLKMTIDELETDPELKVSSQTGLTDTDAVNTSSSFGSLRTTTSNMMEEIHQELEKLSSVELKRISTFAVDVKLDPATAHPGLLLSPDGKSARDGGDHQKVPDGPQRFDVFGSVVGLGALPPGRSYWEVEVGDKTGWDLGVARRDARRKGRLSLDPANGYWVAVHFEGEKYAAMTAPPVRLPLTRRPRRVGVFVDRAEGLVSFYDAAAKSHMYSFVGCAFGGEVLPYFSPHLRQNGENSRPLSLPAVAVVA